MFGLTAKKTAGLAEKVTAAREKDNAEYEKIKQKYEKDRLEWEKMHLMAKGILERDTVAYRDALTSFYPFTDIKGLGTKLDLSIHSDHIVADLQVVGDDYVPNYVLSLTSTGKLSQKDMPVTKFNALYQDHICSCVLRVGRELLAFLPVRTVVINAISDVLNSSTGNRELQTILSVAMVPGKLAGMNFKALDPSDSMKNFEHNMAFSKTGGFSPVEKLSVGPE